MDELIEAIRSACASDASDEAKQRGAQACRTILTALTAKEGEPLGANATQPDPPPAQIPPIAVIVGALRGLPPDQLLDLAIARLRAVLPPNTPPPSVQPVKFHVIPLPPLLTTKAKP